jgi:hypothetical protein
MSNYTLDNDLDIAWTLAAGTRNSEVLVSISDSNYNRFEIWIETFGVTATSTTFSGSSLSSTAASDAGLDPNATSYNLLVRIYAEDETTGQNHSRDYTATIPGPGAVITPPTGLACNFESGWNDAADGGLGAPITPKTFAEFEESVVNCGTAQSVVATDVAGNTYENFGETSTFDALTSTTGSAASPGTGVFDDGAGEVINFTWYVEAATCSGCTHSYVVVESDSTLDPDLPPGFSFRETSALTDITGSNYSFHYYSEQSNYGDMVRNNGSDGEIWNDVSVLQ